MNPHTGYHADLYEIFYREKPYAKESRWIHESLVKYSPFKVKRILELACGTGNHSLHLSRYGYSVTATDKSKDMVRVAKQKLSSIDTIRVKQMDMIHFFNFIKTFDAILCLFDSIGFVQTNENISKVFKNVNNNLKKGGLFVFEYWNAGAMLRSYEPVHVKEWQHGNRKIVRESKTKMNYQKQLCNVKYTICEYENSSLKRKVPENHTNRFFLPQEINSFLSAAQLTPIALFDGYSNRKKITEETWHTVCIAQKG